MGAPSSETDLVAPDGGLRFPVIFILSLPLLLYWEKWRWIRSLFLVWIVSIWCYDKLEPEETVPRRNNQVTVDDVLREIRSIDDEDEETKSLIMTTSLKTLANRYTALTAKLSKDTASKMDPERETQTQEDVTHIVKCCQDAAHIGLSSSNDGVVTSAVSLLALISGQTKVKERYLDGGDLDIDTVIKAVRLALERAYEIEDDDEACDENESHSLTLEQHAAELQQKACLMMGSLADSHKELAAKLIELGGLQVVLDAIKWYRCHSGVAKWSLWATFVLVCENPSGQRAFLRTDGVTAVIQALDYFAGESQDIARHGIAILFDLLREDETKGNSVWSMRMSAVDAGVHSVVCGAMKSNQDKVDIIMMGQSILAGTGFKGPIPQFIPSV